MKQLAAYLPCHSLVCRLASLYTASMAMLMVCYTIAFLMLMQHHTNLELDQVLREELTVQVNRALHDSSSLTTSLARLSTANDRDTTSGSRRVSVDAWMMPRPGDAQMVQQLWASSLAPAISNFQTTTAERQSFDIASEDLTWRAMQVRVVSPARGPILVRVALPARSLKMMVEDILRYVSWSIPLLLLITFCVGLTIATTAFAPIKGVIRATRAIRPHHLKQRLSAHGRTTEMTELCHVVNQLLDRVQIALEQQARFATEVAHELRTPLAAQRSVGELALRSPTAKNSLCDSISAMLEEGQHMHKFVDSLLLVAQADAGLLSRNLVPTNATSVVERCVRTMQPLAEANSQTLSCSVSVGCVIFADETLLRQTLLNLIHNAVKHTQTSSHIEVRATQCAESVIITVSDNGPGFSKFNRDQLVRKEPRKKFDYYDRGLGLGLSIVQSLVRAQEGKMTVNSQRNRGTTVQLAFRRLVVRKSDPAIFEPASAESLRMPIAAT